MGADAHRAGARAWLRASWLCVALAWPAGCATDAASGTARGGASASTDAGADGGRDDAAIDASARDGADDDFGFDELGVDAAVDASTGLFVPAPSGWRCAAALAMDAVCDCGCGALDPGCEDGCAEPGCTASGCEVCFREDGMERACAPSAWSCDAQRFGDGLHCDCGCGVADPDCGALGCTEAACADAACDVLHDGSGRALLPASFSCEADVFDALDGCDCGCGAVDPDCTVPCVGEACAELGGCIGPDCRAKSCERCRDAQGALVSCDFTCALARLGDGVCDCGCGDFDPDCGELGCREPGCFANACDRCEGAQGELPCARGACPAGFEADGVCDCGCRERDPDCAAFEACLEPGCTAPGCGRCYDAEGERIACEDWSCGVEQQGAGDGCNCGCGARDTDCAADAGCAEPGCLASGCVTCRAANGAPMSCMP